MKNNLKFGNLTKLPRQAMAGGAERMPRVNELIKQILARLISEEIEWPDGVLATITKVETARDLKSAKIRVSILPDSQALAVLKKLARTAIPLQQQLNEKIRLRFVPKLKFIWDKTETAASEIDELFKQIEAERKK